MSETKHTPGPWKVLTNMGGRRVAVCTENAAPTQAGICEMDSRSINVDYDGQLANARLIAAAPELLGALTGVLPVFFNDSMRTLAKVYAKEIEAAEAAIAKADGREV